MLRPVPPSSVSSTDPRPFPLAYLPPLLPWRSLNDCPLTNKPGRLGSTCFAPSTQPFFCVARIIGETGPIPIARPGVFSQGARVIFIRRKRGGGLFPRNPASFFDDSRTVVNRPGEERGEKTWSRFTRERYIYISCIAIESDFSFSLLRSDNTSGIGEA